MKTFKSALLRNVFCKGQNVITGSYIIFDSVLRSDFLIDCVHSVLGRQSFLTEQLVALYAEE